MPTAKRHPCIRCGEIHQSRGGLCWKFQKAAKLAEDRAKATPCALCGGEKPDAFVNRPYCSGECARKAVEISQACTREVVKAIRRGSVKKLDGRIACVDCGNPADRYDHRDYTQPLKVDPVCRGCNNRRGPADVFPKAA